MKKLLSLLMLVVTCMTAWGLNGGTSSATAVALAQGDNEIPFVNPAWADWGYAAVAWYYVDVESEGELTLSFSNTGNYNFRYTKVYLYGSDASTIVWSRIDTDTEEDAADFSTTQTVSAGRYYVKFDYAAGVNLNVSLTGGSGDSAIGSHDNPYILEENVTTELKMVYEGAGWEAYGYSNTAVWYAFTATKAGTAVLTLNGNSSMIDYAVYKGETLVEDISNVYEGVSTVEVAEGDVVYLKSTCARSGATVTPSYLGSTDPQPDGSFERPYELVIGDNQCKAVGSTGDPIWYKVNLVKGELKISSGDYFVGTFYDTDQTTALKSVSRQYGLTWNIEEDGTYYFRYDWGVGGTVTVANVVPDGTSWATAYPLHLGENDLAYNTESNKVYYKIDLPVGKYYFTQSSYFPFTLNKPNSNQDSEEDCELAHYASEDYAASYNQYGYCIIDYNVETAGTYYIVVWSSGTGQKMTISKELEWTNFAIRGNFPKTGTNWELRPLELKEKNKFAGYIDASNWDDNAKFEFQFYNIENGTSNYWDNGQEYNFKTKNPQTISASGNNGNMKWVHESNLPRYYVVAEYVDNFRWNVTVTGIPDGHYIPGSWNDWSLVDENVKFDDNNTLTLHLEEDTEYEFKVYYPRGNYWHGCTGTIDNDTEAPWVFHVNDNNNCKLHTTAEGDYTFTFSLNNSEPQVAVSYPVSFSISSVGYATYYNSKRAYIMPDDVIGYIAYYDNGWHFDVSYNSGDAVPAGEGLILKGPADSYKPATATTDKAKEANNRLEGTDCKTQLTQDDNYYFYALQKGQAGTANEGKVGMYWMKGTGGAAFTNGAHKAYMKIAKSVFTSDAKISGFAFDEEDVTGINSIENTYINNDVIYNLNGQRITTPVSGQIYILNGQKHIAK